MRDCLTLRSGDAKGSPRQTSSHSRVRKPTSRARTNCRAQRGTEIQGTPRAQVFCSKRAELLRGMLRVGFPGLSLPHCSPPSGALDATSVRSPDCWLAFSRSALGEHSHFTSHTLSRPAPALGRRSRWFSPNDGPSSHPGRVESARLLPFDIEEVDGEKQATVGP